MVGCASGNDGFMGVLEVKEGYQVVAARFYFIPVCVLDLMIFSCNIVELVPVESLSCGFFERVV